MRNSYNIYSVIQKIVLIHNINYVIILGKKSLFQQKRTHQKLKISTTVVIMVIKECSTNLHFNSMTNDSCMVLVLINNCKRWAVTARV
jgi:hypothetical protein